MIVYIILVYLSHKDSQGLFEGKSKMATTNSLKVIQIFLLKEKKKKVLKLEVQVTKSLQFLKDL